MTTTSVRHTNPAFMGLGDSINETPRIRRASRSVNTTASGKVLPLQGEEEISSRPVSANTTTKSYTSGKVLPREDEEISSRPVGVNIAWRSIPNWIKYPGLIIGGYTIIFFIVLLWISFGNVLTYGPTHTAYTTATINGRQTLIQTSNVGGSIIVSIMQKGMAITVSGPTLNPDAWNNDLSGIVATAQVDQGKITINLIGSPSYLHLFFVRPQMSFSLVVDGSGGYKLGPSIS